MVSAACPLRLYDGTYFGGNWLTVTGDIPDLGAAGFSNVTASLQVPPGSTVVSLWDQPRWTGMCEDFTADDVDLGNNPILRRVIPALGSRLSAAGRVV